MTQRSYSFEKGSILSGLWPYTPKFGVSSGLFSTFANISLPLTSSEPTESTPSSLKQACYQETTLDKWFFAVWEIPQGSNFQKFSQELFLCLPITSRMLTPKNHRWQRGNSLSLPKELDVVQISHGANAKSLQDPQSCSEVEKYPVKERYSVLLTYKIPKWALELDQFFLMPCQEFICWK